MNTLPRTPQLPTHPNLSYEFTLNPLGFHPYSARETPQLPGLSASGIFRAFFVVPYLRYL